jgi:hypothetical protein
MSLSRQMHASETRIFRKREERRSVVAGMKCLRYVAGYTPCVKETRDEETGHN